MADATPRQHHNVTLAALTFAGIAFALQQTLVIPALPALQRDLNTTTTWVTWLLIGFLLVASVATPLLGKSPIKTPSRLDIPGAFLLSGLVAFLVALWRARTGAGGRRRQWRSWPPPSC